MKHLVDKIYVGLPWKDGGRTHSGVDCVGLAWLWLMETGGAVFNCPKSDKSRDAATVLQGRCKPEAEWERGDVLFFANKEGKLCHVAIYLGERRLLHILQGISSRIDTGTELLRRLGLKVAGVCSPKDAATLSEALRDPALGAAAPLFQLVLAILLSAVSALLTPSLSGFKAKHGSYGDGALVTNKNPEITLPDVLG